MMQTHRRGFRHFSEEVGETLMAFRMVWPKQSADKG
jgi:hypothetical protein